MQTINTTTNPIVNIPNDWADLTGNITQNPALMQQLLDLINKQLYFSDINALTKVFDQIVSDDNEIYIGGLPNTEGTWKLGKTIGSEDLQFQYFTGGVWVTKGNISAA